MSFREGSLARLTKEARVEMEELRKRDCAKRSIESSWGLGRDGPVPREALDFGRIGWALP